ncbi:exosortase A (plasmid) [Vibrio alfacsensis]|uniref:exosortase A n=1 Tax=Vibrio alfacsensis TaxID=1074311 RepID=UPI002ADE1522|nr:exosortase A [Vibrio alfacsensis]WQE79043.1 exosortase A [Vibrio alfacsensis]
MVIRFALPFLAWGLVYFESLSSMVTVWMQSKTFEHCFIILPIALWLTWRKKDEIRSTPVQTSWLPVFILVLPSALWMLGRAADVALFEHVAAVFSLQLMLWALLGNPLTKVLFFPIFYLVFCIPFGEELVPYLQLITADITVFALQITNIPVYREGLYLAIPNGLFEVAEACSGIRFLISSLALGTLFAYLSFNKWWKIAIFVGFSFIFPIIANGIRAYGIVLIGYLSDMRYATGADHLVYGWVFFSFVIGIIFFIADKFSDKKNTQSPPYPRMYARSIPVKNVMLILCFLGVYAFLYQWQRSINLNGNQIVNAVNLPKNTTHIETSSWGISFPKAQQVSRGVAPDGSVEYFSARYALSQKNGELISSLNRIYDQQQWSINRNSKQVITPDLTEAFKATQLTVANLNGQSMKILYWYCINDFCSSNPLEVKLFKATRLMTESSGTADVWAIASYNSTDEHLLNLAKAWIANERD